MRKKKNLITLLAATIVTVGLISTTSTTASASYEFDVISDTHIGENGGWNSSQKLTNTLNSITASYPNSQCIVINGDVVDNSNQSAYTSLSNTILQAKNKNSNIPFIYFNIGNHEYNPTIGGYSRGDYQGSLNQFNRNINDIQSKLNTKYWITTDPRNNSYDIQYINGKNSRLVFLGTDTIPDNPCSSYIGNSQMNWLLSTIQANTAEGNNTTKGRKPMFIFSHQTVYDTSIYGSANSDWGYIDPSNSSVIKNALIGHPEIIMFTGHTHEKFAQNDPWNFHDFDTTNQIFSVPSIADNSDGPEGYHVSVYTDGVVVTGVKYTGTNCQKVNTRTVDF